MMTHTQQQPTAANAQSAPSRALTEAMAAHFDGREQNVPYGALWDGAGLEADVRLRQSLLPYSYHAQAGG